MKEKTGYKPVRKNKKSGWKGKDERKRKHEPEVFNVFPEGFRAKLGDIAKEKK